MDILSGQNAENVNKHFLPYNFLDLFWTTGWFPAKFVEMLDERSKEYSRAGDDAVTSTVTDLVRGTLCPAIKAILLHGMRPTSLLGECMSNCFWYCYKCIVFIHVGVEHLIALLTPQCFQIPLTPSSNGHALWCG